MIRVYLVDDHEMVRRGMRDLLVLEGDIRIVGGVSSAIEAKQHIPTVRPDVMVRGSDVVTALRRVANGQSLLDPAIAARVRERTASNEADGLTGDERRVLGLIADGCTNGEIGEQADLPGDAVRACVARLLDKLGLDRAAGLTQLGRRLISAR